MPKSWYRKYWKGRSYIDRATRGRAGRAGVAQGVKGIRMREAWNRSAFHSPARGSSAPAPPEFGGKQHAAVAVDAEPFVQNFNAWGKGPREHRGSANSDADFAAE